MQGSFREAAYYLEGLVADALEGNGCMTPERAAEYAFHVYVHLEPAHLRRLAELLEGDGPENRLEELRIFARYGVGRE